MKHTEVLEYLNAEINAEEAMTKEAYLAAEAKLVETIGGYLMNAELSSSYGTGRVTAYAGETLDTMTVDATVNNTVKKFSVSAVMRTSLSRFTDEDLVELWFTVWRQFHLNLTAAHDEYEKQVRIAQQEAAQKALAEKKAEAKRQQRVAKVIKDFEAMQNRERISDTPADKFYYAIGWLANHVGTVSATLPDYLSEAFKKCFGAETKHTAVDSNKRTVNGHAMQYTFSFKANLRNAENVPVILEQYLGSTGKNIASTSFIWDLVDNYGFQFGKKQDLDKIKSTIPATYMNIFEAGLAA